MNNLPTFGAFDKHCAAILNALGYVEERHEASWEDIGDAENGPKMSGNPAYAAWVKDMDGYDHVIIVADGMVQESFNEQRPPAGWFDDMPDPSDVQQMRDQERLDAHRIDGLNVEFLGAARAKAGQDY